MSILTQFYSGGGGDSFASGQFGAIISNPTTAGWPTAANVDVNKLFRTDQGTWFCLGTEYKDVEFLQALTWEAIDTNNSDRQRYMFYNWENVKGTIIIEPQAASSNFKTGEVFVTFADYTAGDSTTGGFYGNKLTTIGKLYYDCSTVATVSAGGFATPASELRLTISGTNFVSMEEFKISFNSTMAAERINIRFSCSGTAMNQATVDMILQGVYDGLVAAGYTSRLDSDRFINLSGGTAASPSAGMSTVISALTNTYGITVTTN